MLGILRFVLALLVLLSHTNGAGFKLNLGVTSVIIFYFISGYLMQQSYQRFLAYSKNPIRDFYLDRLLKLFPQYGLIVLTSFAAIAYLGPAQHVLFMNQDPSIEKILLNLTLLPANYVFAPLTIEEMLPHPIVPPAWSLAAEFHFYLLLPLVFLLSRRGFLTLFAVTAGIQIGAMCFDDGPFNSDNFGYRFIFGVLIFFLFGYAYAKREEPLFGQLARLIWLVYTVLLLIIAPTFRLFGNPHVTELLLGAVLAWPLVGAALAGAPSGPWLKRADNLLGRLAYPIFISHFLAFYLCEKLFSLTSTSQTLYIPVAIVLCLSLSWGLLRMQEGVDAYRLRRRGFHSLSAQSA
ncbi:acyltransferase family protein [Ectopseudomonas hydrolytica]|uniref:acyltransferase family protein n=1 Tax=Ectopseudomonas hydrolytica TaxID=2493633 RepID=UPI003EDEC209